MSRYNLAYLPSDPEFSQSCISFAVKNFTALADDYCLAAAKALPHVTLCQFSGGEAQLGDEQLAAIWAEAMPLMRACEIEFVCADLRPGRNNSVMAEFVVRRDPELLVIQQKIARMLTGKGIEIFTDSGDRYHPHLTFARLKKVPANGLPAWPHPAVFKKPQPFHPALGKSLDSGVYTETLYPK